MIVESARALDVWGTGDLQAKTAAKVGSRAPSICSSFLNDNELPPQDAAKICRRVWNSNLGISCNNLFLFVNSFENFKTAS